ncbi:transposase [Mongoliitalea lutea]|uniref:Transposase n=2 Tax=Mongoliitalea lutea TaxID=849756 RepID=A0A8J3D0N7_9BACT|nr:transposase [Mongoliitalea lutea]
MRASVEARIRKDRKNSDGTASVYLQVIIDSDRTTIPLKVSWPIKFFDNRTGMFLPRNKSDKDAQDFNMLVQKEKAKINEIFMFYRHSDFELSIEQFHKEYSRYGAKKNFLIWAELDNEDRYAEGKISQQTYKNTKSQLKKIAEWKSEIRFGEIDMQLMQSLETWLRAKKNLKINSAWSILKMVKATAGRAAKNGIAINTQSLGEYKLPTTTSKIIFLNDKELKKLNFYYNSESIPPSHKRVLGQFLFSCYTGLRFSDIQRITWRQIVDDLLIFEPYKTRNIEKVVKIPLIDEAFDFIENQKGPLFNAMMEQPTNRILKDIALDQGIRKNLTTHVARHTFATSFLRNGGHIEVLQRLLGHAKISTTMIYVHVDDQRLREQMELMSSKKGL